MSASLIHQISVPRAAIVAARFLRPPGKFKRAELREKPRRKVGEFSSLVKTGVRLREKARAYSLLPPPRLIPVPLPVKKKQLEPVQGVPRVSPEALQHRLLFLLSSAAVEQQRTAKMRKGLTPYLTEFFMWDRQMRDLRKIYRAQYLQRLAEVTEEEREKQLQLYLQEQRERRQRREEVLERMYEGRKRRAVLKDRLRVEKKDFMQQQEDAAAEATAAAAATRRRLEREGDTAAAYADEELQVAETLLKAKDDAFSNIRRRNISVPELLKQLGQNDEQVKAIKKKITGADNVFREIMEESFALLPEDAPEYDEEGGLDSQRERANALSDRERATVTYAGFSEKEKLQLLDEKIAMLNRKLDEDYALRGGPQSLMYVQLRDHLQAAKIAYQEKKYVEDTERRIREARTTHAPSEEDPPPEATD